ncbi:TetR family transcriptional regulator [Virgibacillus sp. NKC19-16]|uniref:TetR/AcrR family transcriptional regulator n=1 Tax=Virgibacillus salidurans TaxID=2831673 RepID=UPI001F3D97D8|nr:TetR/AcrR family transcriptional regulator [Virgibacillus sp. NKC19-16]UJL45508.1 TetR family transcriptional regulator [Virgibacillus sp. NKC19-16]
MSLRERKTAKKKEDILRMAVSVLSEKGYDGTTMEEIASKLLMTKDSVYYYFRDKQDLLYQSHSMLLEGSIENVEGVQRQDLPVKDKLRRAMIVHIEYILMERSGFEMMIKPEQYFSNPQIETIFQLRDEYGKCFDQLILEGIEADAFGSVDVKIVRNIILGAMNWVTQWYSEDGKKDKKEIAEDIADYLLHILIKNNNGGETS